MLEQDTNTSKNQGLFGVLKIAIIIAVIILAGLTIMWVTDLITRDAFVSYLKTLLIVIGVTTLASVVIALLQRPGNK